MIAEIDTHKDTLAVAVIDDTGRQLAGAEMRNTEAGFAGLVELLEAHQVTSVGIEGSGNFGRAVAIHLLVCRTPTRPVRVVEVPTLMTSRERRAQPGQGKTDPVDALAIARITAREPGLPPVRLTVGPAADLPALLDYREDLIVERSALANRAHAELSGLRPGYQAQIPTLTSKVRVRAALDLLVDDLGVRADLCRRRLVRVLATDAETAELKRQIATLVAETETTLTQTYGIGPLVAARLLAEVVDVRRYPDRNAFAAANGTAPLPASSGRTVRHRFNPSGNRQLNRALYTVALTQIRTDTEGRAYYLRKRAAGKTHREALRCLKRRLSDLVFATMRHDVTTATGAVGGEDANETRLNGLTASGATGFQSQACSSLRRSTAPTEEHATDAASAASAATKVVSEHLTTYRPTPALRVLPVGAARAPGAERELGERRAYGRGRRPTGER